MTNIKWIVTPRQRCDLEMLLTNAFYPLSGFLSQADYENVISHSRLANGQLWPMPVTLDINAAFAEKIDMGDEITLCDSDSSILAHLSVTDKWKPDKLLEAEKIFGITDITHPGVNYLLNQANDWYIGGSLKLVKLPGHYDFQQLRATPAALKNYFLTKNCEKIVGFQTRNPIHRAHMELTTRAAREIGAHVLIHPVVGLTKPGDVDYFTRVRCYQKIMHYYPAEQATLGLLPLAMRMGGPREALWHALIRKNYGCTHFIVGRDHAGPGNDLHGKPFYFPYAAQEMVSQYQDEMGIKMIPFHEMVYVKERKKYCLITELQPGETALALSGTELRQALQNETPIPDWFSFPEIMQELRLSYPPRNKQGFTLFFTGLSGSGKTTLTEALRTRLMSLGRRNITLLDGDVVRQVLTSELGFSKEHRDLNIRRIGFVAAEVTKAGGVVLCAAIAPYEKSRAENRRLISQFGGYIEIHVSTSLAICEKRDIKGLYAKARKGELSGFTGIDDPYEIPVDAEITIDTANLSLDKCVDRIVVWLQENGYLSADTNIIPFLSHCEEGKISCLSQGNNNQ